MRNPIVKAAIIGCVSALWAGSALADKVLKVSHQWSTSDVRHKVAQMVADEVAAAVLILAKLKITARITNTDIMRNFNIVQLSL